MITVIDFYANWCVPCKTLEPYLEEFQKMYSNINFIKINIDNEKEMAEKYNISVLPTIVIIDDTQKVLSTIEGFDLKKITNEIKKYA